MMGAGEGGHRAQQYGNLAAAEIRDLTDDDAALFPPSS